MLEQVRSELAPTGVLRAGVNLSNFLLVSGRSETGEPQGLSPSLASEIANRLGVPVQYVTYPRPSDLADAVGQDAWDIALIGAEAQRAETIAFSAPYAEIEATYLVAGDSKIRSFEEIDKAGIRIAVTDKSAFGLWLDRNIKNATLVRSDSLDAAFQSFGDNKLDALAGLRPRLIQDQANMAGSRILDGCFTAVQQAIGTALRNKAGANFLERFVKEAKSSGLVSELIERHQVRGLSVAP